MYAFLSDFVKPASKNAPREGKVILTDLMERQVEIVGTLEKANLVDGYVIVKEAE